ncbi:MAG: Uncharacterised protein [Cyanobium sp. ARS6]|nr:MAG: Uncharacterised protein [Cyanobium sp. ARS6]
MNAVADAEAGQHSEQSEYTSEPDPARSKALADVIHRATDVVPQFVNLAVVDRQNGFGVFGCDTKESNQPHPEHRTWATDRNRSCHAGDIPCADGGRQRCHQCLEGADVALSSRV